MTPFVNNYLKTRFKTMIFHLRPMCKSDAKV